MWRLLAQLRNAFDATDPWQADVEQDDVGCDRAAQRDESVFARGEACRAANALETVEGAHETFAIGTVILDQPHGEGGGRDVFHGVGIVMARAVPWPGAEVSCRPPSSLAARRRRL